MRLWTLSPHYLDAKGLVALWRETLLAQAVLHGKTKGYKNHPQLDRFRDHKYLLCRYLHLICDEADARGYNFDRTRIIKIRASAVKSIPVTTGQVLYEWDHLLKKLKTRDPARYSLHKTLKEKPRTFSIFKTTRSPDIEAWEII